jgi:hypothetical protein
MGGIFIWPETGMLTIPTFILIISNRPALLRNYGFMNNYSFVSTNSLATSGIRKLQVEQPPGSLKELVAHQARRGTKKTRKPFLRQRE